VVLVLERGLQRKTREERSDGGDEELELRRHEIVLVLMGNYSSGRPLAVYVNLGSHRWQTLSTRSETLTVVVDHELDIA
jgi:hypothetical protein